MHPIEHSECLKNVKNSTIMVTGGAGFIGSHLVDHLLENGAYVIIVDDLSRPRNQWLSDRQGNERLRVITASILERDLDNLMQNVQVVFHLAAISRVMDALADPERTFSINLNGTVRVALAAQRAGVRRLVFSSSREVYGNPASLPVDEDAPRNPINIYGISKAAAEMALNALTNHEPETVILRLANVYGPGDSGRVIPTFINNASRGLPLVLYGGKQLLDLVWIEEVVRVLIMAGFSCSPIAGPVNIGSGVAIPIRALAERVISLSPNGCDIQLEPCRDVEVERFQANLDRAIQYFSLYPQSDPLVHLAKMIK